MKENIFSLDLKDEHVNNNISFEKEPLQINANNISNLTIYSDDSTSEIKLCEIPFIYQKEKYLVDIDQNKIISLYSTFKFLKRKYGLKNERKNRIDCLIKKVKTKYIKGIHEAIKSCVNLYIHRLPQNFTTNIKIEFNKLYLNKTVEQIYTEFKILPSLNELIEKNLIKKGKKEFLILLMTSSLKDIYKSYLSSRLYKYDRMYIKNKEGENVAKLYDYIAQNICQYFLYNRGNKKKLNINKNLYEKDIINNDKIIIQKDVNTNFIKYDCVHNIKDNDLSQNKICKNTIKFNILKYK
jgi:hypothetical protein